LKVPQLGEVSLDLVYAGLWYAVVDGAALGFGLTPTEVPRLVALSHLIREHLNRELPAHKTRYPSAPEHIPQLLYVGPPHSPSADGRNLATSSQLGFDRSPCGTGSCARMALLHSRGELDLGQVYVHESIHGTRFEGRLVAEVTAPTNLGVAAEITGRAHITGFNQLVMDSSDPLGKGFFVPAAS
jgi:proline racemase